MCAWDALAQAAGLPLVKLLGGEAKPVRAYNSCGLWIQPLGPLADDAEAAEDVAAVRAVKKRVGDNYNQRHTVNEAIRRGRMLDGEGLDWIEEPVRHDDYVGCARIAADLTTPIQTGENLVDTFELIHALEAKAMDYVMPDLQRIGGVTGWMRAAAITHAYGMEMSSHLFPNTARISSAVTPTAHWLEYMDWAVPVVAEPVQVKDGYGVGEREVLLGRCRRAAA